VKEALPASATGKPIEIWFQDEARVGQKGTLEYIWAPIGSRPRAVRDNRHDSVYLFGALCAYRAVGAAVIMHWSTIPKTLQRELFDTAGSMGDVLKSAAQRAQIARFLHGHKNPAQ